MWTEQGQRLLRVVAHCYNGYEGHHSRSGKMRDEELSIDRYEHFTWIIRRIDIL